MTCAHPAFSPFPDADTIDGVIVRRPQRYADARGFLCEFFRNDEIPAAHQPFMGYLSVTNPGTSRGPHEHIDQCDYFFFPGPGEFLVVLWDRRMDSSTRGKRMVLEAGESDPATVIVPPGVVHAYSCISRHAGTVINIPNRLYRGQGKRLPVDEIRYEDDPANPFITDLARLIEERRS